MSLADDLLEQAEMLVKREPKHPKQASLRRAVSSAYYALFHILAGDAARLFGGLIGRTDKATVGRLIRTFDHKGLKDASKAVASSKLPNALQTDEGAVPLSSDLQLVAKVFVDLQEARHEADYNVGQDLNQEEAQSHVRDARKAFVAWARVKDTADARIFLACFSLWETWNKKR